MRPRLHIPIGDHALPVPLSIIVLQPAVLTPRETGQLVQALVTVAFAEGGVDQVGPTQAVAIPVVDVLLD